MARVKVTKGYVRKDGTYVSPHVRIQKSPKTTNRPKRR